jgi:hypothetical protein
MKRYELEDGGYREECWADDGRRNTHWYNKLDQLHRVDGPAVISESREVWYLNGEIHRENGPAVLDSYFVGYEEWFKYGVRHRDDGGPAMVWEDGGINFWINGINITKEVLLWYNENDLHWTKMTDEQKVLFKLRFC